MTRETPPTSRLEMAADDLFLHLLPLEKSGEFRRRAFDARWRLEEALEALGSTITDDSSREPRAMFDVISVSQRDRVHDAFVAVLALGQGLQHPEPDEVIRSTTFEMTAMSISDVLDEPVPYVSCADDSLRRVLLDGESLDAAIARIANAR